jgi:hypothetical protein
MNTTSAPAPTGKMMAIFMGTLIFGYVILAAMGYFFPTIEMPGSIGIVFLIVAAMAAGGVFATATKRRMVAGEKFRFAILATLLSLLLTVAVLWGVLAYVGLPFTLQNVILVATGEMAAPGEIISILPIILGVAVLVTLLVCFFGVGFGASNQIKQAERLAAKGK